MNDRSLAYPALSPALGGGPFPGREKRAWDSLNAVAARWYQLSCARAGYCGTVECRADGSVRFFPEPEPIPGQLRWSSERPMVPGYYWCRKGDEGFPRVRQVSRTPRGDLWSDRNEQTRLIDDPFWAGYEWAGPIPEPAPPAQHPPRAVAGGETTPEPRKDG